METLLVATGHCLHPLIIVALNGQIMICSFVNKLVRSFRHIYNLWMLACVILSFSFFFLSIAWVHFAIETHAMGRVVARGGSSSCTH